MNTTNNTPTNTTPETMSQDALIIYFNKDGKMRLIGDKDALFAEDMYIKASIKQGLFMLGTAYGLDFSDDRVAYFPHILDCEFENFLLNYCISQHVPGLYLLHSGDVYIDMKFNTETIEQIGNEIQHPDKHLTHKLRQGDMQQHTGIRLEHRHIQHKEGKRQ